MTADEILLALAIKHNGDWDSIYKSLVVRDFEDLEEYLELSKDMRCQYITFFSEEYPEAMRNQYKPPFVLFYYGDISLIKDIGKNIAVVGSRECTEYGENMTRKIVSSICDDYVIVSGLALGIDKAAHETAIENGGKTIAVLCNGIDYCYLKTNTPLYEEIKRNHLVVSEYPFKNPPIQEKLTIRNRIIAMLSCATLVTEAYYRSGTLSTVMYALQCQRLVLCIPYQAGCFSQCNRLIQEGAFLVENGEQVKEILKNENHF